MLKVKARSRHAQRVVDHGYANKDGHTWLCFGKFNMQDLLFFSSVPYVTQVCEL